MKLSTKIMHIADRISPMRKNSSDDLFNLGGKDFFDQLGKTLANTDWRENLDVETDEEVKTAMHPFLKDYQALILKHKNIINKLG